MRFSLFGKIIGLIVVTAVLVGGIVYGTSYVVLSRGLHEQGQSEMKKMAGLVQGYVDDLKNKAIITASVLAERQDLIMAVEKGDKAAVQNLGKGYVKARQVSVLTIANKDGNVVGRGHSEKTGDSVLQQDNVKKSLAGQASSGIEEGTVVKFSMRAGNSIRNGNIVVGSVTTGFDLSSEVFVDEVKNKYGVECTIFQGDTRISTTIMKDGKRAVGTKMDNPQVIETVLKKGELFLNVNTILGRTYDTGYWPLKDVDGKIVGMLFIGKDRELLEQTLKGTIFPTLLAAMIIGSFMVALSFFMVRSLVRTLNRVISGLTEASDQVSSAAGEVSAASQSLAEGSSQQAASVEETSSSLEEMSSMTKQNASNAGQADSLMKQANQVVNTANISMSQLTTSMQEISKASEETSKIIKTIDEIAFQTNLLALNAAVEAARAGEAGAGFAVVADEVRNLAMRAADAAKNTAALIEGTVKKVMEGTALVKTTNDAFKEVAGSTAKVGELVGEIAAASSEQSQGIEQVNIAVTEMDKVTQQNAATAEESASASEELNAQAEEMKSFVADLAAMVGGNTTTSQDRTGTLRRPKAAGYARQVPQKALAIAKKPAKGRALTLNRSKQVHPNDIIPMGENDFKDL
ncbi:MAG: methyl-accepting chemotaxis protein [Pseudomonadota bacterium]